MKPTEACPASVHAFGCRPEAGEETHSIDTSQPSLKHPKTPSKRQKNDKCIGACRSNHKAEKRHDATNLDPTLTLSSSTWWPKIGAKTRWPTIGCGVPTHKLSNNSEMTSPRLVVMDQAKEWQESPAVSSKRKGRARRSKTPAGTRLGAQLQPCFPSHDWTATCISATISQQKGRILNPEALNQVHDSLAAGG